MRGRPWPYLAAGVTVLQTTRLGEGTTVAVGALVHAGTVTPAEFFVPPFTVACGDPAWLIAPGDPALPDAIRAVGFSERAFGVTTSWTDRPGVPSRRSRRGQPSTARIGTTWCSEPGAGQSASSWGSPSKPLAQ